MMVVLLLWCPTFVVRFKLIVPEGSAAKSSRGSFRSLGGGIKGSLRRRQQHPFYVLTVAPTIEAEPFKVR